MTRRSLCFALTTPLWAQLQKSQPPPSAGVKLSPAPRFALGPMPATPSTGGDKSQLDPVGKHRPIPAAAMKKGRWDKLPGGQRIWRLQLHAQGATGLRLNFNKFVVGQGMVWLYAGSGADLRTAGPYSGAGTDNRGAFWADTLYADAVTIEYRPAPGAPTKGLPPFELLEVSHLFR